MTQLHFASLPSPFDKLHQSTRVKLESMQPAHLQRLLAVPALHKSQSELYREASAMKRHGFTENEVEDVLRARFRNYYRPITDREFEQAVRNADGQRSDAHRRPMPDREKIAEILKGTGTLEMLSTASPISLAGQWSCAAVIDHLFQPRTLLCLGKANNQTTTEPREYFAGREHQYQLMVPNPMSSRYGHTKDGRLSVRCLENVGHLDYQVIEFDFGTLDEQSRLIRHLQSFGVQLRMVVFSGNKSLHSWWDVSNWPVFNLQRFQDYAAFIGADPATFSPCQLVRTPNAMRDNAALQKVIYLS